MALSAVVLAMTAAAPAVADGPSSAIGDSQALSIANDLIEVDIDPRSGSLARVKGTLDGSSADLPIVPAEIVRLRIPAGSWDGHTAVGSQAQSFSVKHRAQEAVTLAASRFTTGEGGFRMGVEIEYRLERDNLIVQLHVTNDSRSDIDGITFPAVGAGPAADASEILSMTSGPRRLREVFSDNRIRVHHDPFERLDPEDVRGWIHDDPAFSTKAFEYPSGFTMHSAWIHYGAGNFGIGIESRDRSFQSQFAVIERKLQRDRLSASANRRSYELSWRWVPVVKPGESWDSPEVILKFDAGDWHAVARQHREWLETWISRPTVAQRFRNSLGWVSRGVSDFDQIPGSAHEALSAGIPYVLIYGWYRNGMNGLSYDFLPKAELGGEESLRRNLREARRLGAYPLAWYNGTTTSEVRREHRERGHDWVVVNRHGGIVVDGRWTLFDPDRPPTTEDASTLMNYDMGTQAAAFNLENVRRTIDDYGFSGFEMDQGAKNYPSYSRQGGAAPPELRYTDGVRRLYEGAREIVKRRDPDNIIVGEGYSDLMNQYVDSTWTFEGGHVDVELGAYARYSLPWVTMPAGIFEPDAGIVNRAFLMNAPLDVFLDLRAHPEFVRHLLRLRELKQAVHGCLYDWDFSDREGFSLRGGASSGVLARSYVARDGRIAVVVVNTRDGEEAAALALDATHPGAVTVHRLGRPPVALPAGAPIELELGSYDVNVIVTGSPRP